MRVVVSAKKIVHPPRVMCGRDAGARHHFADKLHGFAVVGTAVSRADSLVENLACAFADSPIELSGFRIAIEAPPSRYGCVFAYASSTAGERIDITGVPTSM